MAIITGTQSTRRSNAGYPATLATEALATVTASRFSGNSAARRHTTKIKIVWPEKFHQRFVLPSGIEYQPF